MEIETPYFLLTNKMAAMDEFDKMVSAEDFPEQITKYVRTLNIEQCMQHRLFFMEASQHTQNIKRQNAMYLISGACYDRALMLIASAVIGVK